MRHSLLSLLVSLSFVGACSVEKAAVEEDFSDLAALGDKSDAFSYRMTILGSLSYGETSAVRRYTKNPRFRAYKFAGHKGDEVDAWVRSTDGGDAVAWLLDDSFRVLAYNDDADSTLDAHVSAKLAGNTNPDIVTYYVVYRDYDLKSKKFSVELSGKADFFACAVDSDCVAVGKRMCCSDCTKEAVNKDQVLAYESQLMFCPAVLCPKLCRLDERVAQCNVDAGRCEMIEIADIACGGRSLNPHECPADYECRGEALQWDGTGQCLPAEKKCGGDEGLVCSDTELCIDVPDDECDPEQGASHCMGTCKEKAFCEGALVKCAGGHKWSTEKCNCVPTDCRDEGCQEGSACGICWNDWTCVPDGQVC